MDHLDVTPNTYKVSDFIGWQRNGTLELSPSFQRRSVWRAIEKSYLIDTVLRGYPMPILFLRELEADLTTLDSVRQVVDGQQRLRTLMSFISPDLLSDYTVSRDHFYVRESHNSTVAGLEFDEFPASLQSRVLNYKFSVHVLPSETDDREVLQIFSRMNSTGSRLTSQELRNAEFIGEFKSVMYRLAAEQLKRWRDWEIFSEQDIARMEEVELVSEFAALALKGLGGKSKASIDALYRANEEDFPEGKVVARRFRTVMDSVDEALGAVLPSLAFSRKTLIYPLIAALYDIQYGLGSELKPKKARTISRSQVRWISKAGEEIRDKTAPSSLLEQIGRRTTHVATRRAVVEFLRKE